MGRTKRGSFNAGTEDFEALVKAAAETVQLIWGDDYYHFDMGETLNTPYAPNGPAALSLMQLSCRG